MKELYSIGETAALLGVTTQTLRHYDKCGLIKPRHIDPETNYRYYAFDQFHYIDRIKYLQGFGLSLAEIKAVIVSGSVDKLVPLLRQRKQIYHDEMIKMLDTMESLDWYIDYFTSRDRDFDGSADSVYTVQLEKRYALAVAGYPDEYIHNMEVRLAAVKAQKELHSLRYLRQYAYRLDFSQLMAGKFQARNYLIYLKSRPDFDHEHLIELPAGKYLCFRARILTDKWDLPPLDSYLPCRAAPELVIANEYEENLTEYLDTQYEIQILLQ